MNDRTLPELPLADWSETRRGLQGLVALLVEARAAGAFPEKHHGHRNLRVDARGLTTTRVPAALRDGGRAYSVRIDLVEHAVTLATDAGSAESIPLLDRTPRDAGLALADSLRLLGVDLPAGPVEAVSTGPYAPFWGERFWRTLSWVHTVYDRFRAGLREERSALQFWPDHFDLAVVWFSGRRVPGEDPDRPDFADEQMNFGFSTGDETIPEPYHYATAHPVPDGLAAASLPEHARWRTHPWQGAVLPHHALIAGADPGTTLFRFLSGVHAEGRARMLA